jgi:hypothetical protein
MKSPIDLARRMRTSVQIATLAAVLAGCGDEDPPQQHHTAIPCAGIADCKDPGTAPACAYTLSTECHTTTKKCLYRCKNSASCPCLETEIATCNLAGMGGMAGGGYKTCEKVTSTATAWGGCGNL